MRKGLLFLLIAIFVFVLPDFAYAAERIVRVDQPAAIVDGNEPLPRAPYYPSAPGMITQSPGEVVGTTQYDYQTNGSTGNRVALDSQGGRQFAWMNGIDFNGGLRTVYFNYCDASGNWPLTHEGQPISDQNNAGYINIDLTSDDRAAVAYHQWLQPDYVILAVDQVSGFGIFSYFDPPDMLVDRCYWPYIAVDRNDNIHIVSVVRVPDGETIHALGYTMSDDEGESWSRLQAVDTTSTLSQNVVASPVSDKVAIVYNHPMVFDPPVGAQLENNVYYIESEDGLTWDWANGKVNVTEYSDRDSLRAYTDLAAVYDYNDDLHIIWNAQFVYVIEGSYFVSWMKFLYHYDTGSGEITEITRTDSVWVESGCGTGGWNLNIAKMSLGVQEASGAVFATYTGFLDTLDCSAGGYANGDIYMAYSVDGGSSWSDPENLTDSQTPGCVPGDCDSDHWSTLADKVDDYIHIVYINDKDAGGIAQTEGSVTDNNVLYLQLETMTDIQEDQLMPSTFTLSQNYPNPFNARTNIEFELLEDSPVELLVYDITGAVVATVVNGEMEAGLHSVSWDASDVASGVYYYNLKAGGEESTRKMTLLK
jgi:hypothetical protein